MLLKPAAALPRGEHWLYELKFDGFRGLALKQGEGVCLFSRNGRDLTKRFGPIVDAIRKLRAKSAIIDGEIVCLNDNGRPCFEDLQNFESDLKGRLFFYAFDLLCLNDKTLFCEPLQNRKNLLRKLLPKSGPLRLSDFVNAEPEALVQFARENRLEGIVAKRAGSAYEPGKRSGAWTKYKTYQHAEFLVGGFLPGADGIEALALGFWRDGAFRYSGRVEVYWKGNKLQEFSAGILKQKAASCPFERVPIKKTGDTWSVGLTREDADRFVWAKPMTNVLIRFTEWTRSGMLRHAGLA